jgi:hypothetical protein
MKLFITQYYPVIHHFSLLGKNIFLSILFSNASIYATCEVLTAVTMKLLSTGVWRRVVWYNIMNDFEKRAATIFSYPEDGRSPYLWNIDNDLLDYTASHQSSPQSSPSTYVFPLA